MTNPATTLLTKGRAMSPLMLILVLVAVVIAYRKFA